jgi:ATPase subunit of ABC transporter with duplicated ATPase domains
MAHVEISDVVYDLPDGRPLLGGVSLRVGEGSRTALIGPNGTGKTTLLRIVAGELAPVSGAVVSSGGAAVMPQDVGADAGAGVRDVRDLLLSVAAPPVRAAAAALDAAELAMMEVDDEPTQLAYAQALADWGDVGGYDAEVAWDVVCTAALGVGYERTRWRDVSTLSGGERKRLVLEALLRGPEGVLLLDEPDNSLDVPGKRWLEEALIASGKTVLLISHDRELLHTVATRVATLEPGAAGARLWVHGGGMRDYAQARADRTSRLEELRRRWDEDHAALKQLVVTLKQKATFNDSMSSRYHAAQTRLARFEEAGPPEAAPTVQRLGMRLRGGRTGRRAVVLEQLGLTGLVAPFDLELHLGDRLAVLGSNGSGKSHLLRLLAAGGTDPGTEHQPVGEESTWPEPVAHTGTARLGARVRPGWFRQSSAQGAGGTDATLLEVLHRGDGRREGMGREQAMRALDRYGLAGSAEQTPATLSGGQRARFGVLLLDLSGATLLLLDEPTDNLDLESAEALEAALDAYEGTVVAVTHDRWFARSFDRFLVLRADGTAAEVDEPVWDEPRVVRAR